MTCVSRSYRRLSTIAFDLISEEKERKDNVRRSLPMAAIVKRASNAKKLLIKAMKEFQYQSFLFNLMYHRFFMMVNIFFWTDFCFKLNRNISTHILTFRNILNVLSRTCRPISSLPHLTVTASIYITNKLTQILLL